MAWPKGKPRPLETRQRMSEASKAALADPAVRQRMSEARKAALADPAVRQRMSEASKAALADPAKGPLHLRGLTGPQRDAYRLYRRKGFSRDEALALVISDRRAA